MNKSCIVPPVDIGRSIKVLLELMKVEQVLQDSILIMISTISLLKLKVLQNLDSKLMNKSETIHLTLQI